MKQQLRSLPLSGATNFRDLGGYTGHDGQPLRWRRLFRSDHLAHLSVVDVAALEAIGVSRVLDFRGSMERETLRCALPKARVHSLSIEPTVVQGMKALLDAGEILTPDHTISLMKQTYCDFVHHNSPRFAELFEHLMDDDAPLVFHCTAGKDRTGFAAALILFALGVSREDIMQDYLLTNFHYKMPVLADSQLSEEVLGVLWRVQEGFLESAFETVEAKFGGMQNYLQNQLGVGESQKQRLRDLYLQKE
jgi:protein-tyrosine phosphatase